MPIENLPNVASRVKHTATARFPADILSYYISNRCAIYPLDCESKRPLVKGWNRGRAARTLAEAQELFADHPGAGLGIATEPSDLTILDGDPRNGADESFRLLVERVGLEAFDGSLQVLTPSGGFHQYFRGSVRGGAHVLGRGIDVMSIGGGVVAPPTTRAAGAYRWRTPFGNLPEDFDPPPLPKALRALIDVKVAKRRQALGNAILPIEILCGARNVTLVRYGGILRKLGAGEDEILAALEIVNTSRCQPPLGQEEVHLIASSVSRYAHTIDSLAWLSAWSPSLSKRQLRVAIALHSIAQFILGDPTPALEVMLERSGLPKPAYYDARAELVEMGAIRVITRGRKFAPIIQLIMPSGTGTETVPLYKGLTNAGSGLRLLRTA